MKLCGVREGELRGLLGHGASDFCNTVANVDHRGLAGGIEIAAAGLVDDRATFAADGDWVGLAEVPWKKSGVGLHDGRQIVAEGNWAEASTRELAK